MEEWQTVNRKKKKKTKIIQSNPSIKHEESNNNNILYKNNNIKPSKIIFNRHIHILKRICISSKFSLSIHLPNEIFVDIFSYLNIYDILSVELVCLHWYSIIKYYWKDICLSSSLFNIQCINSYSIWPIIKHKSFLFDHSKDLYSINTISQQMKEKLEEKLLKLIHSLSIEHQLPQYYLYKLLVIQCLYKSKKAWIPIKKLCKIGEYPSYHSKIDGYYCLPYSDKYTHMFGLHYLASKDRIFRSEDQIPSVIKDDAQDCLCQINLSHCPKGIKDIFNCSEGLFQFICNGFYDDGRTSGLDFRLRLIQESNDIFKSNSLTFDYPKLKDESIIIDWKEIFDIKAKTKIHCYYNNKNFSFILDTWSGIKIGGYIYNGYSTVLEDRKDPFVKIYIQPSLYCRPHHNLSTLRDPMKCRNIKYIGQFISNNLLLQVFMCTICNTLSYEFGEYYWKTLYICNNMYTIPQYDYSSCLVDMLQEEHWEYTYSFDKDNDIPEIIKIPWKDYPLCKRKDCYHTYEIMNFRKPFKSSNSKNKINKPIKKDKRIKLELSDYIQDI